MYSYIQDWFGQIEKSSRPVSYRAKADIEKSVKISDVVSLGPSLF